LDKGASEEPRREWQEEVEEVVAEAESKLRLQLDPEGTIYLESGLSGITLVMGLDSYGIRYIRRLDRTELWIDPQYERIYKDVAGFLSASERRFAEFLLQLKEIRTQDPEVASKIGKIFKSLGSPNYILKQAEEALSKWSNVYFGSPDLELFDWILHYYSVELKTLKEEYPGLLRDFTIPSYGCEREGVALGVIRVRGIMVEVKMDGMKWSFWANSPNDLCPPVRRVCRNLKMICHKVLTWELGNFLLPPAYEAP